AHGDRYERHARLRQRLENHRRRGVALIAVEDVANDPDHGRQYGRPPLAVNIDAMAHRIAPEVSPRKGARHDRYWLRPIAIGRSEGSARNHRNLECGEERRRHRGEARNRTRVIVAIRSPLDAEPSARE